MVTIELQTGAVAALAAQVAALAPAATGGLVGRAAVNVYRSHFDALESRPNRHGWPKTHFWSQARRSTNYAAAPDGAQININQVGVAQRLRGGPLVPTGGRRMLTIPACAEAYGRRAGEFSSLVLRMIKTSKGLRPALAEARATEFRKTKKGLAPVASRIGKVFFWLVPYAVQKPDPGVLPPDSTVLEAIRVALAGRLADLQRRPRPAGRVT